MCVRIAGGAALPVCRLRALFPFRFAFRRLVWGQCVLFERDLNDAITQAPGPAGARLVMLHDTADSTHNTSHSHGPRSIYF